MYERLLAGASVRSRHVEVGAGSRVHLLEKGAGPPVVLLHGTGNPAGFLPLLNELHGVRAIACDRPGVGLSDPVDLPGDRYRESAVAWLDRLLDTLELDTTTLLGHSGGGVWALWYALAHPDRVERLVLLGVPTLPETRCPLPIRLVATPGWGGCCRGWRHPAPGRCCGWRALWARRTPSPVTRTWSTCWWPRDGTVTDRATRAEFRALVSPFALLSPSGFRRHERVRPDELRLLAVPTLVLWGERDPVGGIPVARAVTELIPDAHLEVLPTGHGPWLGLPTRTAATVTDFCCRPLR